VQLGGEWGVLIHRRCSLFKSSSYGRKIEEKSKINIKQTWRITFVVFLLLLSLCGKAGADSFPPAPPQQTVVEETSIHVSSTTPASTVFINVTKYDAKQIVKNITLEFREPVTYVSFTLKTLSETPSYVDALNNSTVLQYYTLTFLKELTDKIANVEMDFAIEKDNGQKNAANEETLVLYQYNGEKMKEWPTEKVAEDDAFLYFRTKTEGASYLIVTGGLAPLPSWFAVFVLAFAALIVVIVVYGYRRFKLTHLREMLRTGHGK
jgi:PGF-pre-PGF domain-containing protein